MARSDGTWGVGSLARRVRCGVAGGLAFDGQLSGDAGEGPGPTLAELQAARSTGLNREPPPAVASPARPPGGAGRLPRCAADLRMSASVSRVALSPV